jgi:CRP-like cAMP-binding protein/CheY-like chemotaxis protein
MIQISKVLQKVPIFRMLGKESIDFIVERLKFKTFDHKATICEVGDPGDTMYIIITGKVDIVIFGPDGSEQVVATLGAGDYFGEMALLTGETRSATVRTTEESEMFLLHKNDFDVILERFPSISLSMGKIVSKRLRETLSKATSMPKPGTVKDPGLHGSLVEKPLVNLISFCESNSLTGTLTLIKDGNKGVFNWQRGEVIGVMLGDKKDDAALDELLTWEEGEFEINSKPLSLDDDDDKKESIEQKEILIVNNSLVVRKLIERAFKGLGYKVNSAENIEKSNALIAQSVPDVIISDVKLADGPGLDFCKEVKAKNDVPFIFLTDDSVRSDFAEELESLGKAELTKTHEVSEIVKLVENMI